MNPLDLYFQNCTSKPKLLNPSELCRCSSQIPLNTFWSCAHNFKICQSEKHDLFPTSVLNSKHISIRHKAMTWNFLTRLKHIFLLFWWFLRETIASFREFWNLLGIFELLWNYWHKFYGLLLKNDSIVAFSTNFQSF